MQNLSVPRLLGCGNWGVVCAKLSLLAYLEYYSPRYTTNKLGHCARCMALSEFLLYFEDALGLISFYGYKNYPYYDNVIRIFRLNYSGGTAAEIGLKQQYRP